MTRTRLNLLNILIIHCSVVLCFLKPRFYQNIKCNIDIKNRISTLELDGSINDWIASKVPKSELKVTIENDDDDNYYAKAITAINPNMNLFVLPENICISALGAVKKFSKYVKANQLRTGDLGMLALSLLSEKYRESKSDYSTYIEYLPQTPPGILSWSESQLQELYKSTTRNIEKQILAVKNDFEIIQKISFPSDVLAKDVTLDDFMWAMGIVKSRMVYLDGDATIVPGMDFISFDPFCESEAFLAGAGVFGGKVAKILSDTTYNVGDEVFMSYGLKSSAECLEDHGFVPNVELDDASCEISVSIDEEDKYPEDKIDILNREGFNKRNSFDLESNEDSTLDERLLKILRLKFIEGQDSFILESCFYDTVFEEMSLPFSKKNEEKVLQYIMKYCENMLSKLDSISSDNKDNKLVDNESIEGDPEFEMAKLRLQERAALRNSLKLATANLMLIKGPDPTEYYQERRLNRLNLLKPLEDDEIVMPGERGRFDDDY